MFSVRQRIALWFVGLSTLVYVIPTLLGMVFFYASLTGALDHELRTLASSLGHAIDVHDNQPHFRDWARIVQTDPKRSLCTIQLYDAHEHLLEHYGAAGIPELIQNKKEASQDGFSMRIIVTPLISNETVIGYLQIQIPTKERDYAMRHFAWTISLIAPFVLAGLGFCSYYVSDKATVPIEQTIAMLRQFVADAGHELNTPLSVINATVEILERKLDKQEIHMKETDILTSSAERMQKIISDLILLAELDTPSQISKGNAVIPICELMDECLTELSFKFEQKDIKIQCILNSPITIHGDREAIKRVITNLLENAHRYTDKGGEISIDIQSDSVNLKLRITDTGIGIPEDSLPLIFDRFYRVDKSRNRASGGSGLGLSITKAIVEAHDGSIDVQSKPGKGTEFTICLPLDS